MSENITTTVEDTKTTAKRRNLVKIGKHLARQITRQGITEMSVDAVIEAKRVDRVQAKAIIKHAESVLASRGFTSPFAAA